MKGVYPKYGRGELKKAYRNLDILEKNKLDKFIDYCSINAKEKKLEDIRRNVVQFRLLVKKNFDDINLEDLRNYLSLLNNSDREKWTKNGIKIHIKKFLRWNFRDWSIRFDEFIDVKNQNGLNEKKVNENNLVTEEELELLLRTAERLRDKALITLLYESGARPQEIRELKWEDLKFTDDGLCKVHLYSKKKDSARTILVKDSVVHLKRWKQEWAFKNIRNSDYVFPTIRDRKKSIDKSYLSMVLRRLSKKSKLSRPIYPYLLRHSRLNELYKILPEQIHKKFAGHSKDSRMTAIYSHINSEDVAKSLLENVYKIKEINPKTKHKLELEVGNLKSKIRDMKDLMDKFEERINDKTIAMEKRFKKKFPTVKVFEKNKKMYVRTK